MREVVTIDITHIREKLEALPEIKKQQIKDWTQEEDDLLLEFWPSRNHRDVATLLGVCKDIALRRYKDLTG
jgi:hypothetical protein